MAITFSTDRLQGLEGTAITGVYCRIQSVTVKKYDATSNPSVAVQWKCLYDVVLHGSAAKRNASGEYPEWGNRLNSREIDHFSLGCTTQPATTTHTHRRMPTSRPSWRLATLPSHPVSQTLRP